MIGLGLRHTHFTEILNRLEVNPSSLNVDFFEIITENFFQTKGRPYKVLEKIRESVPISFHGVSLSIASCEEIDYEYLKKVKELEERMNPFLISDHLCWTGVKNKKLHNLLPFPYNEENLKHLVTKIHKVQDFLKRPLLLENLSAYLEFAENKMTEAQFLNELHLRTGCHLLLDLNNVYVNSHNQNFSADDWLRDIPAKAVKEIHLAGFSDMGSYYFDTHSCPIWDPVWDLYERQKDRFTDSVTLIEWDEDIPSYERVLTEVKKARLYEPKNVARALCTFPNHKF